MILEAAPLQVRPGQSAEFEAAFREAQAIIASMPGYRCHRLERCIEREGQYLLLVEWESVSAHEEGFRKSAGYQDWKRLLHHFYDPFPTVLHYEPVDLRVQGIRVAPVTVDEIEAYRSLMLEAYRREPEAFTSTPEEREVQPIDWWLKRIGHGRGGDEVAFGAFVGDGLAGTAGLEREARQKSRHKATLFGMYVRPAHRGHGLARRLVEAVLAHARNQPGLELVQLTVSEGNEGAKRLYERCGFRVFGVEPRAIRVGERYLGKVHMSLDLR